MDMYGFITVLDLECLTEELHVLHAGLLYDYGVGKFLVVVLLHYYIGLTGLSSSADFLVYDHTQLVHSLVEEVNIPEML
jgi:hypothetical protein